MNKSNIKEVSAGTQADSSTTAQNMQVSQPNANTNVVCSPSKLILNQSEFKHDVVRSNYNSNFYNHKKLGYTIHEICHEDYNFQEFYFIDDADEGQKIFLGCSTDGFGDGDNVSIDFKVFYT